MKQATLYLMLGYPGAGKTTVAKVLSELTGAEHVWADKERRERIGQPTYSHQENTELYERLNKEVEQLIAKNKDVIFDTNFSFFKDRLKLTNIAKKYGAKTIVVWVKTDKSLAKERSIKDAHQQPTRLLGDMTIQDFERISEGIEEPRPNEVVITIDGTKVTPEYIKSCFDLG